MKFIIGKKIEMTQVFQPDGTAVAVTKILAGPCLVVQKKTDEKDGYIALKCAFQEKKKANSPLQGIFKKFGKKNYQYLREFCFAKEYEMYEKIKEGDVVTAGVFEVGDVLTVSGVSKGKGFQGVVKRHGFKGGPASHGHKDQLRMPGSIGATGPARVFKGTRMGGQMGNQNVTTLGLEIIDVDVENNMLSVKGSIPGARNGLVKIVCEGSFEIVKDEASTALRSEDSRHAGTSVISEEKKIAVKREENPNVKTEEKAEVKIEIKTEENIEDRLKKKSEQMPKEQDSRSVETKEQGNNKDVVKQ